MGYSSPESGVPLFLLLSVALADDAAATPPAATDPAAAAPADPAATPMPEGCVAPTDPAYANASAECKAWHDAQAAAAGTKKKKGLTKSESGRMEAEETRE